MKLQSFFTKQRYIILGVGLTFLVLFIVLAHVLGHESEAGLLFIDFSGVAVTIVATALVIELLQYREKMERTHQVADLAEEEIQAICYRVKLAVVKLYGFRENVPRRNKLASVQAIQTYLEETTDDIKTYYKKAQFKRVTPTKISDFQSTAATLQVEIENIINLFDYALPHSMRARVLALRSKLQITERSLNYMQTAYGVSTGSEHLARELTDAVFNAAQDVLNHESRVEMDKPLAQKPGRVGKQS